MFNTFYMPVYQQIEDTIAECKTRIYQENRRLEDATNSYDIYASRVLADEQVYLLQTCLEFGILINGKKPTKKTTIGALQAALLDNYKNKLKLAEIHAEMTRLAQYLSNLRKELREATVTLPLSFEDMMLAGAMESELHKPLEVQKVEVSPELSEVEQKRLVQKRFKESATYRQVVSMVKELDNSQRAVCTAHAIENHVNLNIATLTDEQAQYWIDFIVSMRYQDMLTRETVIREVDFSRAMLAYHKPEKPGIPATVTKKGTAKKIDGKVYVTSKDEIVFIREKQTDIPTPIKEEKKIAQVKPAKEAKKPAEKPIVDSLVTAEQEAACIIWPAGEYPGMSIPEGFRVRKERDSGLYRVDHWTGTHWETYINKAGKVGYTRFASELKQWFDKWQVQLGIAA